LNATAADFGTPHLFSDGAFQDSDGFVSLHELLLPRSAVERPNPKLVSPNAAAAAQSAKAIVVVHAPLVPEAPALRCEPLLRLHTCRIQHAMSQRIRCNSSTT
jgi:hypothetical protein